VTQPALTTSGTTAARGSEQGDLLIRAVARYVEALHRRYPEGPEQLHREGLDARAKVSQMVAIQKGTAA
jgi:hypothetical protein